MVEERLVGVVEQLRVVLVADAASELVVVVGRETDEREDLARLRVHGDHHAALDPDLLHRPLERLLGVPLLLGVDRERQRVARLGLCERLEDLGLLARGVLLDTLRAVDAPQAALVLRFDADLADQVVGEVAVLFQVEELLAGDRTRVAEDLRHQRPVRVQPSRLDRDLDSRKLEAGLRDEAGGPLVHVGGDPDEIEGRPRVAVDGGVDVGGGHAEEGGQAIDDDRALIEWQVRGAELDDEGGHVRDEGAAVAVVDQAARCRDRLLDGPIVGRKRGKATTVDDLEIEESRGQAGDRDDHREGEDEEAGEVADGARTFVVERAHQSSRSDSVRRSWIEIASGPINAARIVS